MRPVPATLRAGDLDAARALREAVYALAHDQMAGRALSPPALAIVNALAAAPDPAPVCRRWPRGLGRR